METMSEPMEEERMFSMPRGVKGSGKKAKTEAVAVEKTRKAYPTLDERIAIADKKIESLTNLNNEREALVAKTEKKLEERKVALARSTEQLNKVLAHKEHLVEIKNRPAAQPGRSAAKSEERKRAEELLSVMKAKGISMEELLAKLEQ